MFHTVSPRTAYSQLAERSMLGVVRASARACVYYVPAAAAAVGSLRETMMAKEDVHNDINVGQTDRLTKRQHTFKSSRVCVGARW